MNEEKTKEEYVADSSGKIWFHTGDIGQIHPNGIYKYIYISSFVYLRYFLGFLIA